MDLLRLDDLAAETLEQGESCCRLSLFAQEVVREDRLL